MSKSKKVGLLFGSFNPLHVGHMILANYFVEETDLEEIWFVVSPQNPFKESKNLLSELHRYAIIDRTIDCDSRFKVSNIEFDMPRPSYTIDTLAVLTEKYPQHQFSLIMGSDNLQHFHKWKNAEVIMEHYRLLVYPQKGFDVPQQYQGGQVVVVDAPEVELSASYIRNAIKVGKDVSWFMPDGGRQYVQEMNFYK